MRNYIMKYVDKHKLLKLEIKVINQIMSNQIIINLKSLDDKIDHLWIKLKITAIKYFHN